MADTSQLMTDGLKRAVDAQMRYYRALGDVTTEYFKALMGIWTDAKLPIDLGTLRPRSNANAKASAASPSSSAPALVMEAEAGQQARGAFMVENKLARHVSTPVVCSAFIGPDGVEANTVLEITPAVVELEPGAKTLVHITASITDRLDPGATYGAEITVPGLSDSRVPLVLRRRASAAPSAKKGKRSRGASRRQSTGEEGLTT